MGNPFDMDVINYDVIRAGKEFNNNCSAITTKYGVLLHSL